MEEVQWLCIFVEQKYSNLCELCRNPQSCQDDDRYAGFRGSLRCLTEREGDVAWTKLESVYQFFAGSATPNNSAVRSNNGYNIVDFAFLCPDGTQVPLNSQTPCTWAGRPWKAFMASTRLVAPGVIADLQQQISLHRTVSFVSSV